jgi:hypothetical protein
MPRPIQVYGVKHKEPDTKQLALTYILIAEAMLEQEEREATERSDAAEESEK